MTNVTAENILNCVRQCKQCKGNMQATRLEVENSAFPWRDQSTRFICDNCKNEALIAEPLTVLTALCTGLFILAVGIYTIINGFFDFLVYNFSGTIGFKLLAVFLGLLFTVFTIGAAINLLNCLKSLLQRQAYPVLEGDSNIRPLMFSLLLGIIPWVFAAGLGYINYQWLDDNALFGFLILPVVASPIFFAPKFKVSHIAAFLACAFWGCIAGLVAWIL